MINSGIRNDALVYRASTRHSSGSVSDKSRAQGETDIYEEHSMELENRLISSEIENNPNSQNDRVAHSNFKKIA